MKELCKVIKISNGLFNVKIQHGRKIVFNKNYETKDILTARVKAQVEFSLSQLSEDAKEKIKIQIRNCIESTSTIEEALEKFIEIGSEL